MVEEKAKKTEKKSDQTRSRIVSAFVECLATHGYAQTKLSDIAETAGLATPHLRYYFKNKESILEYQYERVVARFQEAVFGIVAESPEDWFDNFGKLLFETKPRSQRARQVLMEANLLVAHSRPMKRLKKRYDENMLSALERQFVAAEHRDPARSASVTFHFLSGLMLNTAFESKESRDAALPLFQDFIDRYLSPSNLPGTSKGA